MDQVRNSNRKKGNTRKGLGQNTKNEVHHKISGIFKLDNVIKPETKYGEAESKTSTPLMHTIH